MKKKLFLTLVLLFLTMGCLENKSENINDNFSCIGPPRIQFQIAVPPTVVYTTEVTSDSCHSHALERVLELNTIRQEEQDAVNPCYPISEYTIRNLEQKYFTGKENLNLEEIEEHIKNICNMSYSYPPVQEILSLELKEGQFHFTYEFMDETYEGQVFTTESDKFNCPIFRIVCSTHKEGEVPFD